MKKKDLSFVPMKKGHNNVTYAASEGMENCHDLHLTRTSDQLVMAWKLPNLWARLRFLFKNELTIILTGHTLPPIMVTSDLVTITE